MFVEKIILEQLHPDGNIATTIIQSEHGRQMLIDYAERIDIDGAHFGPYTIIRRDQSSLETLLRNVNILSPGYRAETFKGRLSDHSFHPMSEISYTFHQEWNGIPVGEGGCAVLYAIQLPTFANIDALSFEGDRDEYDNKVIRDKRINAYFITKALIPEWNDRTQHSNSHVSVDLSCEFTIDEKRFSNEPYQGKFSDKYAGCFKAHNNEIEPIIQKVILSGSGNKNGRFVFLSHKSEDKPTVEQFASELKKHGITPWYDEWNIMPGDSIPQEISKGIEDSDILVFFLSPKSVEDSARWVSAETSSAFHKAMSGNLCIIPVLLGRCHIPQLFQPLKHINVTEFGVEKSINNLIEAIEYQRSKLGMA
jgi:hypothetical protein